jgi:hypothetical protein
MTFRAGRGVSDLAEPDHTRLELTVLVNCRNSSWCAEKPADPVELHQVDLIVHPARGTLRGHRLSGLAKILIFFYCSVQVNTLPKRRVI